MGYYMGPGGGYYAGYRGDPGFFGFLGGLAKKAVGMIPGVGPAISTALGAIGGAKSAIVKKAAPIIERLPGPAQKIVKIAGSHPVLSAAGAAGVAAGAGAMIHAKGSSAGAGMGGAMVRGGGGGRHKRMNVCNPRALRRAIRRTHGFAKLAMKTIHLIHPKKHATFGGFKRVKHAPRRKRR